MKGLQRVPGARSGGMSSLTGAGAPAGATAGMDAGGGVAATQLPELLPELVPERVRACCPGPYPASIVKFYKSFQDHLRYCRAVDRIWWNRGDSPDSAQGDLSPGGHTQDNDSASWRSTG